MKNESFAMQLFLKLGLERIAWSLRRLHCPVNKDALVLEVGSGGNPYARSNVLLDAYEETRERHWAPLVADRPTVLGFVEQLPFRDKAFDFVIACHVLEHSADPERFLNELQRVARAGYIEVPDAFMERVNPYRDHRLEVTERDGELLIRKKQGWCNEPDTVALYEHRVKPVMTGELIPRHPFAFHVRYFWQDTIRYRIINPETDAAWEAPAVTAHGVKDASGVVARTRSSLSGLLRSTGVQTKRNRMIDLRALLRCPSCEAEQLENAHDTLACRKCGRLYPVKNGIPLLFPRNDQEQ